MAACLWPNHQWLRYQNLAGFKVYIKTDMNDGGQYAFLKQIFDLPNVLMSSFLQRFEVFKRQSWVILSDSRGSKRLSAQREESNFNSETEGLMKQLSAWLQLNYSSSLSAQSPARYSHTHIILFHMLFHSDTKSAIFTQTITRPSVKAQRLLVKTSGKKYAQWGV